MQRNTGVVSLAGIDAGIDGIRAEVDVGRAWRREPSPLLLGPGRQVDHPSQEATATVLDEAQSKKILAKCGVPIPPSLPVGGGTKVSAGGRRKGPKRSRLSSEVEADQCLPGRLESRG